MRGGAENPPSRTSRPRTIDHVSALAEAGVSGVDQLDPVAERIADITATEPEAAPILLDRDAGGGQGPAGGLEITDQERGMRSPNRPEVRLRAKVDHHFACGEPAPTPIREFAGLPDFSETQDVAVKRPRLLLGPGRHRQLHVIDADDLDHGSGVEDAGFGFDPGGVGFLALGPAVAALQASMSWPAHGS